MIELSTRSQELPPAAVLKWPAVHLCCNTVDVRLNIAALPNLKRLMMHDVLLVASCKELHKYENVCVLQILRIGAFEILHCNVAPHAVNEHVTLCRTCGHSSAAGFTNAVLRALLRQRESRNLDAILPQVPAAPLATFDDLPRKCSSPALDVLLWFRIVLFVYGPKKRNLHATHQDSAL
jgi:hypothetical protein